MKFIKSIFVNNHQLLLAIVLLLLATIAVDDCAAARRSDDFCENIENKNVSCGKVASVQDGDTIRIVPDNRAGSTRVRLQQIDAPEMAQDYGSQAKAALLKLVPLGSRVCIVSGGVDIYGRLLGNVCRGSDVNLRLVAEGHVWCYRNRCPPAYMRALAAAQAARKGLWGAANIPEPPWVYRRRNKQRD